MCAPPPRLASGCGTWENLLLYLSEQQAYRTFRLERRLMAIKGFERKVRDAKFCSDPLGLVRV
jgi:hypothetical protein